MFPLCSPPRHGGKFYFRTPLPPDTSSDTSRLRSPLTLLHDLARGPSSSRRTEAARSCRELQGIAWRSWCLPRASGSAQALPGAAGSCRELPGAAGRSRELPTLSRRTLPSAPPRISRTRPLYNYAPPHLDRISVTFRSIGLPPLRCSTKPWIPVRGAKICFDRWRETGATYIRNTSRIIRVTANAASLGLCVQGRCSTKI